MNGLFATEARYRQHKTTRRLPSSCSPRAPGSYPRDAGSLRNCPKVTQKLSKGCSAHAPENDPQRCWRAAALSDSCPTAAQQLRQEPRFGRILAKSGRSGPKVGRCWPKLARTAEKWGKCGQVWRSFGKIPQKFVKVGHVLTKCGPTWSFWGQVLVEIGQIWSKGWRDVGQNMTNCWWKCWPKVDQIVRCGSKFA